MISIVFQTGKMYLVSKSKFSWHKRSSNMLIPCHYSKLVYFLKFQVQPNSFHGPVVWNTTKSNTHTHTVNWAKAAKVRGIWQSGGHQHYCKICNMLIVGKPRILILESCNAKLCLACISNQPPSSLQRRESYLTASRLEWLWELIPLI